MDAKVDPSAILAGLDSGNFKERKAAIAAGVRGLVAGHLAQDADVDDVAKLLDALEDVEAADAEANSAVPPKTGEDESEEEREKKAEESAEDARSRMGRDESEEEREKREAEDRKAMDSRRTARDAKRAADAAETEKKEAEDKKAMDAKIQLATDEAIKRERDNQRAIVKAMNVVRPVVGELEHAFDSAEDVYKAALKMRGVQVDGVHASAYPSMWAMASSFTQRYPGAAGIGAA
jgi:chemotaxis protein histidine kinase CheA